MNKTVASGFFLLLVSVVTVIFLGLIRDFLLATFWAIILTMLFSKQHESILAKMPNKPNGAAALTVVYALIILIVPLVVISATVVSEATQITENFNTKNKSFENTIQDKAEDLQDQIPIDIKTLKRYGLTVEQLKKALSNYFDNGTQSFTRYAIGFTQNVFSLLLNLFLMLYMFFFFLADGKKLVKHFMWVIPMKDENEKQFLERFESVARATVKGSLVVAFIQGTIGGLVFWALGIEGAFLWGVIMIITSLLPIGSALIWAPWAVILISQGEMTKGIILIALGAGLIGLIDNFLRPHLVGQDTQMADYLILLSTLGGITWFGISGFVIGPVVAALFSTCWQIMGKEYGNPVNKILPDDGDI